MVLPNQLTILRIVLTPVFVFFFLQEQEMYKHISLGIFFVAAITDWYDGWLARKFNYITNWGKFWDPLADKILTAGAFFSLVHVGLLELWMVLIVVFRDFTVTILRGFADKRNISFATSRYAKWKTFFQMLFLYYLLLAYVLSSTLYMQKHYSEMITVLLNSYFIFYGMLLVTLITLHSGYKYFVENRLLIKKLWKSDSDGIGE
ncbi:MAG: CDP-diacylglycerol--glycerol-3-phosphate 3-phosphatidyltransferase [Ignavibacteriaceae bacterium]